MKAYVLFIILGLELTLIGIKSSEGKSINNSFETCFVIDPGHGGRDNGCHYQDVLEDEINLDIAKNLMSISVNNGLRPFLTRSDDYDLSSNNADNHKREDLNNRVNFINSIGAEFFISLHVNSYPSNTSVHGPMVYYHKNNEDSKLLAIKISEELNKFTKNDKPIHYEDFYLFKHTKIPGVLIECGFISNAKERNDLTNSSYQLQFANTIYIGINNYILKHQ